MARKGIKDKVAIIACDMTKYGELWDKNQYDLLFEAFQGALKDGGLKKSEIDASWVGIFYYFTGLSGAMVEDILRLDGKPSTRSAPETEESSAGITNAWTSSCAKRVSARSVCAESRTRAKWADAIPMTFPAAMSPYGHSSARKIRCVGALLP